MKLDAGKFPERLLIGFEDGVCNLKCPMCFVHGKGDSEAIKAIRGRIPLEDAIKILDEIKDTGIAVTPNTWTEPLILKDFKKYASAVKDRGLKLVLNTNGLKLDEDMAKFLVDIETDSIFVSIDAHSREVLMKTRGVDQIEKIQQSVHTILKARGDKKTPRIGVSFTENKDNLFERDDFVQYWIKYVDVIRVNKMYENDGSIVGFTPPAKRYPCNVLYDTMYANHKGQVSVCCLDGFSKTNIGNILKDGLANTWNGDQFTKIRELHEAGRWDEVPMCKGCQVWTKDAYTERKTDTLLIRESSLMSYYNRLDRLSTWVNPIIDNGTVVSENTNAQT